jgi:hypothetical protein
MAYNASRTDHVRTREWPVAAGQPAIEEGLALILKQENGVGKAAISGGASDNDLFIGFAMNQQAVPAIIPYVQEVQIPDTSPYTVTIDKVPVGSLGLRLKSDNTAFALDAGGGLATGEYQYASGVLTFAAADAGKVLVLTHRYSPTLLESMYAGAASFGNSGNVTLTTGTTGVIEKGEVFTTCFDPTVNWSIVTGASVIKAGANGLVQVGGTGATIHHALIINVPSAENPMLGIKW